MLCDLGIEIGPQADEHSDGLRVIRARGGDQCIDESLTLFPAARQRKNLLELVDHQQQVGVFLLRQEDCAANPIDLGSFANSSRILLIWLGSAPATQRGRPARREGDRRG